MLKRIVCFTVLWLSNIILLLHAAVPHHYHEDTGICFVSHCKDSKETHRHENCDLQNHRHEGNHSQDVCNVENAYFRANDNTKCECCPYVNCKCEQWQYELIDNYFDAQYFDYSVETALQPELYSFFFHSEYISQSLGLRAPPAC